MSTNEQYQELLTQLKPFQQEHLLQFWEELTETEQSQLAEQIRHLDLDQLQTLIAGEDAKQDFAAMASRAVAPPSVNADGTGASWTVAEAKARGIDALRAGHIGAVIVAGGQGTRLGFDQPKGLFPIGPVSNRTLFQFFADRLIATQQTYETRIPLFIMTSDATDASTRTYFEDNDYLGLAAEDVFIFKQGTMPAVDAPSGKVLLATKGSLALSPDGHGGTVGALSRSGCLDEANKRGVRHLAYIQVDNPLAHLCDPTLLGHHLLAESELTTQVIRKRYASERVGNVVSVDGKVQIIEYSDLPDSAAESTDASGDLRLWAGNIAVHVIAVEFLSQSAQSSDALPFHRAFKKVPYVAGDGELVSPDQPNAIKFERFIFDLLPRAENAFVVEVRAAEGFAPVKNANGSETDTPDLAKKAISDLHRGWLESAGAVVTTGVQVELNPQLALDLDAVRSKISGNLTIDRDSYFDTQLE